MNDIKDKILKEYAKGNIIVLGIEGLQVTSMKDFLQQPVDGMLYDLNRDEATVLASLPDPKWINDYAAGKVIRALMSRIKQLEKNK